MNDQLIVTKLRPMSEINSIGEDVLLFIKDLNEFRQGWLSSAGIYWTDGPYTYEENEIEGWIPMPSYQPEKP